MTTFKSYFNEQEEVKEDEKYEYPEAGVNAPGGIVNEVEKFRNLPISEKEETPLLYYLLGSGTPDYKMAQSDAKYVDESPSEKTCGNCEFLYLKNSNKKYIWSQIRGEVKEEGRCKLWAPQDEESE